MVNRDAYVHIDKCFLARITCTRVDASLTKRNARRRSAYVTALPTVTPLTIRTIRSKCAMMCVCVLKQEPLEARAHVYIHLIRDIRACSRAPCFHGSAHVSLSHPVEWYTAKFRSYSQNYARAMHAPDCVR